MIIGASVDTNDNLLLIMEYYQQLTQNDYINKNRGGKIKILSKLHILFDIGIILKNICSYKKTSKGLELFALQHPKNSPPGSQT